MTEHLIKMDTITDHQRNILFGIAGIIDSDEFELIIDSQIIMALSFDTKEELIEFKLKYF